MHGNELRLLMGQIFPAPDIVAVWTIFNVFSYDSVSGRDRTYNLPDYERLRYVLSQSLLIYRYTKEICFANNMIFPEALIRSLLLNYGQVVNQACEWIHKYHIIHTGRRLFFLTNKYIVEQ